MSRPLDRDCINTLRYRSKDMVQRADRGHSGLPLGVATMAYDLGSVHLTHNLVHPDWADRDRFVLAAGHGSTLLMTGYELSLNDQRQFRQWVSKAGGHTPGVESKEGPLGQGMANAEAHLAAHMKFPDRGTYNLLLSVGKDTQSGDVGGWRQTGRNLHFVVHEHAIDAIVNGLAELDGFLPFGSTFFVFSDYMRPALRLAALMGLHVVYVFPHVSIVVDDDDPTHQPVEQFASRRAMPNPSLIRSTDANETAVAWKVAVETRDRPVLMVLTRRNLPTLDRGRRASAEGLRRGAYVVRELATAGANASVPELILLTSGSEVSLTLSAAEHLQAVGVVDALCVNAELGSVPRPDPALPRRRAAATRSPAAGGGNRGRARLARLCR